MESGGTNNTQAHGASGLARVWAEMRSQGFLLVIPLPPNTFLYTGLILQSLVGDLTGEYTIARGFSVVLHFVQGSWPSQGAPIEFCASHWEVQLPISRYNPQAADI